MGNLVWNQNGAESSRLARPRKRHEKHAASWKTRSLRISYLFVTTNHLPKKN